MEDDNDLLHLTQSDRHLIIQLGSSASLDESPRKNWVENAGGLPPFVREVARAIMRDSGKSKDNAIQIAIGRIKKWAAQGNAKAAKAAAQWEALKVKNKAKQGEKIAASALDKVLASRSTSGVPVVDPIIELTRRVKTQQGADFYNKPIGSIITGLMKRVETRSAMKGAQRSDSAEGFSVASALRAATTASDPDDSHSLMKIWGQRSDDKSAADTIKKMMAALPHDDQREKFRIAFVKEMSTVDPDVKSRSASTSPQQESVKSPQLLRSAIEGVSDPSLRSSLTRIARGFGDNETRTAISEVFASLPPGPHREKFKKDMGWSSLSSPDTSSAPSSKKDTPAVRNMKHELQVARREVKEETNPAVKKTIQRDMASLKTRLLAAGVPQAEIDSIKPNLSLSAVPLGPALLKLTRLTTEQRKKLSKKEFAIKNSEEDDDEGEEKGRYPIPDKSHARNALSRVAQHGSSKEKKQVKSAVKKKYPAIGKKE